MKYDYVSQMLPTRVVALGGGTGLSTLLRGLKENFENITAIVTVGDDGGGSGAIRRDLGISPPGDIRNCILALAEAEPILQKLFDYRFSEGTLTGQSFGNLFLAAMTGISRDFSQAVQRVGDVLAVSGDVLPVSDSSNMRLSAKLSNGKLISGESQIGAPRPDGTKIEKLTLNPSYVQPTENVIKAINRAELIILSSGSIYTSIIPNLLVDGVADAIYNSKAPTFYVANIMMQPGETVGYTAYDHVKAIEDHTRRGIIDCVIANDGDIDEAILNRYREQGVDRVTIDRANFKNTMLVTDNLVEIRKGIEGDIIRHNTIKLAKLIRKMALDMMETKLVF